MLDNLTPIHIVAFLSLSGIILRSAGPDGVFGNNSDDDDLFSDIIK